jgi:hypothetical protein
MTPTDRGKPKGTLVIGIGGKPSDDKAPPDLSSPEAPDEQEPVGSEECENCRFYSMDDAQCKRFPEWMPHSPDDWCGEFAVGKPHQSEAPDDQMVAPPQGPPQPPARTPFGAPPR